MSGVEVFSSINQPPKIKRFRPKLSVAFSEVKMDPVFTVLKEGSKTEFSLGFRSILHFETYNRYNHLFLEFNNDCDCSLRVLHIFLMAELKRKFSCVRVKKNFVSCIEKIEKLEKRLEDIEASQEDLSLIYYHADDSSDDFSVMAEDVSAEMAHEDLLSHCYEFNGNICVSDGSYSEPESNLTIEYSSDVYSDYSSDFTTGDEETMDEIDDESDIFQCLINKFIMDENSKYSNMFETLATYYQDGHTYALFLLWLDADRIHDSYLPICLMTDYFVEKGVAFKPHPFRSNLTNLATQADFIPSGSAFRSLIGMSNASDKEELISFFEDTMTFMYMCMYGHENLKVRGPIAITVFVKLRMRRSIYSVAGDIISQCSDYMEKLFSEMELQSDESVFGKASEFCDRYEEMCASPIFNKLYKLALFMISMCLFKTLGIEFDKFNYFKIEKEAICSSLFKGPDFVFVFLKTILFVCKRGYQCMITGSLDPLYHSGDRYEQWMNRANELKRKSKFLNNPTAHGFSRFEFIKQLREAIVQGDCIYKHASRIGALERRFVNSVLSDLKIIEGEELTRKAAMQTRKVPFSLLLSGGSKVAKSQLSDLLFAHYGKLFDLPIEDEYRFTRIFQDEYWTNFSSSQWALQMDDVSFLHPQVAPQGDPTVMELLQVVNNVPYIPPQAALEDKGKNPVLARFVIATTNVEHLNALYYFNNELAVRRRLPFIVEVKPKACYSLDGATIKPDLLPPVEEGCYPDFWNLTVKRVVCASVNSQRATTEDIFETNNIYDFIEWFNKEAQFHERIQERSLACKGVAKETKVCQQCRMPDVQCRCNAPCFLCNNVVCMCHMQNLQTVTFLVFYYVYYYAYLEYIVYMINFINLPAFRTPTNLVQYLIGRWLEYIMDSPRARVFIMRRIGNHVQRRIGQYKFLINIVSCISLGVVSYKLLRALIPKSVAEKPTQNDGAPVTENERLNPWVAPSYMVTSFDYHKKSLSYKALPVDDLKKKILDNCVHLTFTWQDEGDVRVSKTRAFCVKGHVYVINTHAIPFVGHATMEITQDVYQNISRNTSCLIHRNEFSAIGESDISTFIIDCLPPKKDLLDLFVKKSYNGVFNGFYLAKDISGNSVEYTLQSIKREGDVYITAMGKHISVWKAHCSTITQLGDCGSIAISMTELGPLIVGFHVVGGVDNVVGIQSIDWEILSNHILQYVDQFEPGELNLESDVSGMSLQTQLHYKSVLHAIPSGTCSVYGSMKGYFQCGKSGVRTSILKPHLESHGITSDHVAPNFRDERSWTISLNSIFSCKNAFDRQILRICGDAYIQDIKDNLPEEEWKLMQILDDKTTVNGKNGVTFIDAINKNTSMGYPWRKSKRFFLNPIEDPAFGEEDFVEFAPEFYEGMREMEDIYRSGRLCHPIFYAHQKDEPISLAKHRVGKVRLFTGANAKYSMLVRKHFLTFVRVFQRNPYVFEGAPGMVCQSLEWEKLREYLTTFNTDCVIDGDYKHYDKNVMAMFIREAFRIIIELQNYAGQEDSKVREGLAEDTAYPFVVLKGDLLQFYNMLCSGIPLTVIVNCIVNSLYMRYCYYILVCAVLNTTLATFKQNVKLMTYGDDNSQNVKRDISALYNHISIAKILSAHGIEYTMADKSSQITPFRSIAQISFLKRTFRWDDDIGAYVAPLAMESIHKMLCINVVSKTISREETAIACISSALREYFYYGRSTFVKHAAILRSVAIEAGILHLCNDSTFPAYEELVCAFWHNSAHVTIKRVFVRPILTGLDTIVKPKERGVVEDLLLQSDVGDDKESVPSTLYTHQGVPRSSFLGKLRYVSENTTTSAETLSRVPYEHRRLNKISCFSSSGLETLSLQADAAPVSLRGATGATAPPRTGASLRGASASSAPATRQMQVEQNNTRIDDNVDPAEVTPGTGGLGYSGHRITETSQTVRFVDDSIQDIRKYDVVNDPDSLADTTEGNDLSSFLSRPVQLGSFAWASTGAIGASLANFNPWNDYLANTNIIAKLQGWAFLRANLKLKFLTNASPFLYGAARVGYTPLQNIRPSNLNFTTSNALSLVPFSQLPGAWIYPQANQGCELDVPFISLHNMLDIRNTVPIVEGRIRPQDMGNIDVRIYAPLRSANAVAAPATVITVYAWLENVVLSGPSLSLPLQARDEYGQGPISKNASAIATAAGALRDVPIIGPYATATQIGAKAVARAASAYGYTNTPVIDDHKPMRTNAYPPIASAEIGYPIEKLTIDPKNELTVDPHVVGLSSEDELSIKSFVTKESYLTTFTWVDNELVEANKFLTAVAPHACASANTTDVANNTTMACAPVAFLNHLFRHWRGGLKYRFVVIGTKFHKGRLRISYDPQGSAASNLITTAGPYDERVVSTILDLEGDTDVEFYVPYQQHTTFQECRSLTSNFPTVNNYWQTSGFAFATLDNSRTNNGMLNVRVLTPLTGPVTPTTIQVLVFVRAADDFEFANPIMPGTTLSTFPMQADITTLSQIGENVTEEIVAGSVAKPSNDTRYLTYMGERIVSLRQLMRRMSYLGSQSLGYDAVSRYVTYQRHRLPMGPGPNPSAGILARNLANTANIPYSWEQFNVMSYVSACFVALRGSMIWSFEVEPIGHGDTYIPVRLTVMRNTTPTTTPTLAAGIISAAASDTQIDRSFMNRASYLLRGNALSGGSVTDTSYQPVVNILAPFYSKYKMAPSHPRVFANPNWNSNNFSPDYQGLWVEVQTRGEINHQINEYCAIGTDFNFHFFLCVPLMYAYATPAGPT